VCAKVGEALRPIDNKTGDENAMTGEDGEAISRDQLRVNVAAAVGLPSSDQVLMAHPTDNLPVQEHSNDYAVLFLPSLNQLLVVVCGTRMIPAPKMRDVFMDLWADAEPFLGGEAHQGMSLGARNILTKIRPLLESTLREHPGCNVAITGYSLGAGICQLLAMELAEGTSNSALPVGTEVRSISFGAPPVFKPTEPGYKCRNLFSVVYNNDGLASASISTVTKLFMQVREVEKLQMRRRDMFRLVTASVPTTEGGVINDDDEDEDDDFVGKASAKRTPLVLSESYNQGECRESCVIRICGSMAFSATKCEVIKGL